MQELISILIPVFNRSAELIRSVNSCLQQTYQNIEIIIVNDGSTDGTGTTIADFCRRYPLKVKGFWQDNGGAPRARNHAISQANGHYILFLDSDDCLYPNALESLHSNLGDEFDGIYGDVLINFGQLSKKRIQMPPFKDPFESIIALCPLTSSVLYRSKRIASAQWDETLRSCQDFNFTASLVMNGLRLQYVPQLISEIYQDGIDRISNKNTGFYENYGVCFERLLKLMKDNDEINNRRLAQIYKGFLMASAGLYRSRNKKLALYYYSKIQHKKLKVLQEFSGFSYHSMLLLFGPRSDKTLRIIKHVADNIIGYIKHDQ